MSLIPSFGGQRPLVHTINGTRQIGHGTPHQLQPVCPLALSKNPVAIYLSLQNRKFKQSHGGSLDSAQLTFEPLMPNLCIISEGDFGRDNVVS